MNFFKFVPGLVLNFVPRFNIIPAIIGAGAALVGAGINYFSQKKSNDQNASIAQQNYLQQQANLDYQKAVQQQTWQREDTAWQRAVSDIQKTGMSPLALSGGAATSTPVSTTAAQNNFVSSAPQVDSGAIANASAQVSAAVQAKRQMKLQTQQMQNQVEQQKIENAMKNLEFNEMKRQFDQNYAAEQAWRGDTSALNWSELARKINLDDVNKTLAERKLNSDDNSAAFNQFMALRMFTETQKNNEANRNSAKLRDDYQQMMNDYFRDVGSPFGAGNTDKALGLLKKMNDEGLFKDGLLSFLKNSWSEYESNFIPRNSSDIKYDPKNNKKGSYR